MFDLLTLPAAARGKSSFAALKSALDRVAPMPARQRALVVCAHLRPGRLKRRADFLRVASLGKKAAVGGVVLQALPRQDAEPTRLGFTVTRKVGNAVTRNRARRRLKEAGSKTAA